MRFDQIVSFKAIILLKALHRFQAGNRHSLPPVDGSRDCDVESGGLARNRTGVQGFAVCWALSAEDLTNKENVENIGLML
jgi:hypothetical protein